MHAEKLIMFSFFFRILFVVILEDIFSLSTAAAAAAVWLCVCCGVLCFFFRGVRYAGGCHHIVQVFVCAILRICSFLRQNIYKYFFLCFLVLSPSIPCALSERISCILFLFGHISTLFAST